VVLYVYPEGVGHCQLLVSYSITDSCIKTQLSRNVKYRLLCIKHYVIVPIVFYSIKRLELFLTP